jgi:hypothetical protein
VISQGERARIDEELTRALDVLEAHAAGVTVGSGWRAQAMAHIRQARLLLAGEHGRYEDYAAISTKPPVEAGPASETTVNTR